jgi:hypothetical protein
MTMLPASGTCGAPSSMTWNPSAATIGPMRDASYVLPPISVERKPRDPAMAALAARRHGVVARRQLAAIGRERHAIAHDLERGRAVLSHRSAAALWGIRETRRRDVEVTAPRRRRGCGPRSCARRRRTGTRRSARRRR